ncbi:MAG: 4Fe-4S binding protein [Bacteroidota bacterium]|jgi:ferredoxin-type protein NapH|nr:4Fe-4S binding protein [Algoriphagus sp.]
MNMLKNVGLGLFLWGLAVFTLIPFLASYRLTEELVDSEVKEIHREKVKELLAPMYAVPYASTYSFLHAYEGLMDTYNEVLKEEGRWEEVIWEDYGFLLAKAAMQGPSRNQPWLCLLLSLGSCMGGGLLFHLAWKKEKSPGGAFAGIFHSSLTNRGLLGILVGSYLILFYVILYWFPAYFVSLVWMVDPLSRFLSGGPASQWFLYGLVYTLAILVMGIRMFSKYAGNRYQQLRTASVMFFQTAFAFLIPEVLVRLNQPYFDFKNIWPLDYDFFFDYQLSTFLSSGGLGLFMLVWGCLLIVVAVPVFTYFYGKRWYCSWVCGCGGLAETVGDSFRHLSDKSLKAWKWERWTIHGVLALAVFMTTLTLVNYFSGFKVLGDLTNQVHAFYGFAIGSAFAGVVGTGFYPLMGNRVWCRFGCPLAAYLGLVQRFKSRFRITTNGGQCISCGNCSTHCEMGIDVRAYAQQGQNIVRSSCVGCGICATVCPRGVLKLENGPEKDRIHDFPILIGRQTIQLKK